MKQWFIDNTHKLRNTTVDAFRRFSAYRAISLLAMFLFQAIVFIFFKLIDKKILIGLMTNSKLVWRHVLRVNFELANKIYNRKYINNDVSSEFDISPIDYNDDELTILASSELDHRYEWLEHEIDKQNHDATIIYMPNWIFNWLTEFYLGQYMTGRWGFDRSQPGFERSRELLKNALAEVLKTIKQLYDPDLFLSASLADMRWRETIDVARQNEYLWVVTEREGVVVPAVRQQYPSKVRDAFYKEVDLMTTSNPIHYNYWQEINQSEDSLALTGDLKSDIWKNRSRCRGRSEIHPSLHEEQTLLLYFAFGPKSYINRSLFPDMDDDWSVLRQAHFEVLHQIATEYPDSVQIVIKSGHTDDFTSADIPDCENVLELDNQYSALELIINSDIIVGFQTTAMIESMFTESPIIYPAWGDLHDSVVDELIPLHETRGISHASSQTEFEELLRSHLESPSSTLGDETMAAREEFRSEYYYHVGSVADRTYAALEELVESEG